MALSKEQIAKRIAKELKNGYYVNLGIGIPTLVANYIPDGIEVVVEETARLTTYLERVLTSLIT